METQEGQKKTVLRGHGIKCAEVAVEFYPFVSVHESIYRVLEEYGIERKMRGKDVAKIVILTIVAGALFIATIIYAGIQGADSGMSIWRLGLRFLIFFWMVSIFDAVVLDWWMFTKTDIFGILIKKKTGRMPDVMRVDPQWDGKEFLKLFLEVIISVVLAWVFIKLR